jgi:hypothetical protein
MVITGIQRQRAAVASGAQRAEASHVTSLWSVASAKSPRDEQTRDASRSGLRPEPGCARVRPVLRFARFAHRRPARSRDA